MEKGSKMTKSNLEKYIQRDALDRITPLKSRPPEVIQPSLLFKSNENFGNKNFSLHFLAMDKPFEFIKVCHKHTDDQFLMFIGGDLTKMGDLGGEVELTLSEDGKNLEKFTLTTATWVYVPAGLYHCPITFKKINDPRKPILFIDSYFGAQYSGKIQANS
jgi:hypothetical protein